MKILIADIRNKKNISLGQLSKMTGIPKSTISDYENKKHSPRIDFLEKIAIALHVKISDLYESKYK
ncbi:MAG: helix-turn-helix domain-containing protein [Thomasclavelia sp.]|uniref:helix-turn-helix domain-containing protein n=1 Tax=Thomasclavelia sp. TaxID=3025757 RepID=UPI0039A01491